MGGGSGREVVPYGELFFAEFCLKFPRFRKVNLNIYERSSLFRVGEYVFNCWADGIHGYH